jgi:hypothetical protein
MKRNIGTAIADEDLAIEFKIEIATLAAKHYQDDLQ